MNPQPKTAVVPTKARRTVDLPCGFFIVLSIVILGSSSESTLIGSVVVAVVIFGLGVDAVVSAVRNKQSFVSRIGPLPW